MEIDSPASLEETAFWGFTRDKYCEERAMLPEEGVPSMSTHTHRWCQKLRFALSVWSRAQNSPDACYAVQDARTFVRKAFIEDMHAPYGPEDGREITMLWIHDLNRPRYTGHRPSYRAGGADWYTESPEDIRLALMYEHCQNYRDEPLVPVAVHWDLEPILEVVT